MSPTLAHSRNSTPKLVIILILALALGGAIIFGVLEAGNYNGKAAVLQACMDAHSTANGCPSTPINAAQISNLHGTADSLRGISYGAGFILFFCVIGAIMDKQD